jgi:streptogramin lyase
MAGDITLFPTPSGEAMWDITAAGSHLWFSEQDRLGRVSTAGTIEEFPAPVRDLQGVALGPDGNIWFTAGNPAAVGYYSR